MKCLAVVMVVLLIWPFTTTSPELKYSFNEAQIRKYIPISTNNITADRLYARIVESNTEIAYTFMFYYEYQEGYYELCEHKHDWEFIVVYTYPNQTVSQINYNIFHYYIGRTKNPETYSETNPLVYVDDYYHHFKPDRFIRKGNVSWQVSEQKIYELTDEVLLRAQQQVGFDPNLYINPFNWKDKGWFGRYTAFDSWWKAFWVVADYKFDWIDFSDDTKILTKMI